MDLYGLIHETRGVNWRDIVDSDLPLFDQVLELVNRTTRLPNHNLQSRIFAASCLINPLAFKTVPIVWLNGPSGSGKTTLMELANLVIGWEIEDHYLPGSSNASVRNDLRHRFYSDCVEASIEEREPQQQRHGARLTVDNVYNRSFNDDLLYVLILTGYRKGAALKLASQETTGTNVQFPIYSVKYVSSIDDPSEDSKLTELSSRLLLLRTDHFNSLAETDIGDFDVTAQLQLSDVDWTGFSDQFNGVWVEGSPVVKRLQEAVGKLKKEKLPSLTPRQREITLCAVASAYAFSNNSLSQIVQEWMGYWEWVSKSKRKESLLASLIRKNFLEDEMFEFLDRGSSGMPVELTPSSLQEFFKRLKREGQIRQDDCIDSAMAELGYYRKEKGREARWFLRGECL